MVAVIGDIHGCFYTLMELVNLILDKYKNIPIYSVGDLVDRGNFSYDTMEFIINNNIMFTPGNHDYMFMYFFKKPFDPIGRTWFYNGFEKTLLSYQNRLSAIDKHLEVIDSAPLYYNLDDCFISHAGISTLFKEQLLLNNELVEQNLFPVISNNLFSERGILWTRDELLNIGKLQVVGHTRKESVSTFNVNNSVYIDTSVYTGNTLSAVIIEKSKIIETISVPVIQDDIK